MEVNFFSLLPKPRNSTARIHFSEEFVFANRIFHHLVYVLLKDIYIFKVIDNTVFNLLSIGELETDEDDKPLYPARILSIDVIHNPFDDIEPRIQIKQEVKTKELRRRDIRTPAKRLFLCCVYLAFYRRMPYVTHILLPLLFRTKGLISFEDDLDEGEVGVDVKKFKSSHDMLRENTEGASAVTDTTNVTPSPLCDKSVSKPLGEPDKDAIEEVNSSEHSSDVGQGLEAQMYVVQVIIFSAALSVTKSQKVRK